jgi:bacterioferritin-associated ferredoxin
MHTMADVICLCNQIWDEDLREYLATHKINSIEELRQEASICNKCMQCEELVQTEIYHARIRRQQQSS